MDALGAVSPFVLVVAGVLVLLVGVPLLAAAVYLLVPEWTWPGRAALAVLNAYAAALRGLGRLVVFVLDCLWWW